MFFVINIIIMFIPQNQTFIFTNSLYAYERILQVISLTTITHYLFIFQILETMSYLLHNFYYIKFQISEFISLYNTVSLWILSSLHSDWGYIYQVTITFIVAAEDFSSLQQVFDNFHVPKPKQGLLNEKQHISYPQ